jgi:hypothetical protein
MATMTDMSNIKAVFIGEAYGENETAINCISRNSM